MEFMLLNGKFKQVLYRWILMDDLSHINWQSVDGGVVTIGGSRRGVLFGEFGPKHECSVPSFQISSQVFNFEEIENFFTGDSPIEQRLLESFVRLPTEGEWELAFQNQILSSIEGIELLGDFVPERGYWGQPTDGRPKGPIGFQAIRDWSNAKNGIPKSGFMFEQEKSASFRLVRNNPEDFEIQWGKDRVPLLPMGHDPIRRASEEVLISIIFGIIPSFIWAFFNASPDYIREGWPGLVLGGIFIGVFSAIFWRPAFPVFSLNKSE
jgi:hypothetical protein